MIITLTGSNDFARRSELRKLTTDFIATHTDMAVERFDGDESNVAHMRGGVSSLPFLTERKMVILVQPGKQKAFMEQITDILQDIADTTDLVIVEPKLDKRLAYYKTLKKSTDFRECTDLDAAGLARWASDYAKKREGDISSADARFLIDRIGPNQQLLSAELDKLLAYDSHITKQTVELLVEQLPQSTVFELLDAAFAGRTARAMALYHEQRALKVEPQAIVAMLAWQLHILALIKTADQRSADDIARLGKVNPYVVRKSQGLARNLALPKLKGLIAGLLDLDIRLKSVTVDADEALQLYLLQVAA